MIQFGDRLKKLRKDNKYSQKEFGALLGVGQTTIANYEKNIRLPNHEILLKIATILNASIDELLGKSSEEKLFDEFLLKDIILENILDLSYEKIDQIIEDYIPKKLEPALVYRIYEQVVIPIMHHVGDLWESGIIGVGKEHQITNSIRRFVDVISHYLVYDTNMNNKSVICISLRTDKHTLGIRMISDYFRLYGYSTIFVGDNLPVDELLKLVDTTNPFAIAVSVTMQEYKEDLIHLINDIKNHSSDIVLFVGGQGLIDETSQSLKVDYLIKDFNNLKDVLNTLNEN